MHTPRRHTAARIYLPGGMVIRCQAHDCQWDSGTTGTARDKEDAHRAHRADMGEIVQPRKLSQAERFKAIEAYCKPLAGQPWADAIMLALNGTAAPLPVPVDRNGYTLCVHGYGLMRDSCPGCHHMEETPHAAEIAPAKSSWDERTRHVCRHCSKPSEDNIHNTEENTE